MANLVCYNGKAHTGGSRPGRLDGGVDGQDASLESNVLNGLGNVDGQEAALDAMEERIGTISAIAERNMQNAAGTEQSSSLLAREAEALRFQVKQFVVKEERNG